MRFSGFASFLSRWPLSRWLPSAFFVLVLLLGLRLFDDYGVSWDEQYDHYNGAVNAKYVTERLAPALVRNNPAAAAIEPLAGYSDRDHGPAFEYPVFGLTQLLGLDHDSRPTYLLRHLCVFLVFYGGLLAFYGLVRRRYGDWRLGLLGAAALWGTPRLFAESFYNAKDLTFLAAFTLGMYTLSRLLHRPHWHRALLHGLALGAAVALRVTGVLLVPLTLVGLGLTWLRTPAERRRPLLLAALLWLPAAVPTALLFWPWLWEAPWTNLTTAFRNLSQFTRWGGTVLYRGELLPASALPWHYAPTWIALTTPLAYLVAFGLGLLAFLARLRRRLAYLWETEAGTLDLLTVAWLLGPLLAVVWFDSVLYDGWRHLYFVYPALVLLALGAVQQLARLSKASSSLARRGAQATLLLLGAGALEPGWRIVRDHPRQQVYFNQLISAAEVERGFERDYWGLGYRAGLEWILRHDHSPQISVSSSFSEVVRNNLLLLPPRDRTRFVVKPPRQARYFLTNYRWHPQMYTYADSVGWEVYAEYSRGIRIMSVYRRD
ncbi:ArnT family glycosyltransferase [Hymenobacter sp. B81]|uniref:ArnT family glycosyltransferase n=1 Tax=Hymenobacter sp. B81 TaxID=3344878 RepID=UPI0037DD695F